MNKNKFTLTHKNGTVITILTDDDSFQLGDYTVKVEKEPKKDVVANYINTILVKDCRFAWFSEFVEIVSELSGLGYFTAKNAIRNNIPFKVTNHSAYEKFLAYTAKNKVEYFITT